MLTIKDIIKSLEPKPEPTKLQKLIFARDKARQEGKTEEYHRLSSAIYYHQDPERGKKASAEWVAKNREAKKAYCRKWGKRNRKKVAEAVARWRKRNPDKIAAEVKAKSLSPFYKLKNKYDCQVKSFYNRGRLEHQGVQHKKAGRPKRSNCQELCGCTELELYRHLGEKPRPGASWARRYATDKLNLEDPRQKRQYYHFTNIYWKGGEDEA